VTDELLRLLDAIPDETKPRAFTSADGHLDGIHLGPRAVANLAHVAGFRDDNLFAAVAICGSESWMFTKAYNDNVDDATGQVVSRDVGLWQINIPASRIGTSAEAALYDPATNASAARDLFISRGFQPWVGFTSNAYLHDTYTLWAYMGVANRWAEIQNDLAVVAGMTPQVKVPAISIPTMRKLYPTVPLG